MPICPECEEEIEELRYWEKIDSSSWCSLDKDGRMDYEGQDNSYDNPTGLEWCCPKCSEVLFEVEDEAITFLENDDLKVIVKEKLNKMENKNADMSKV